MEKQIELIDIKKKDNNKKLTIKERIKNFQQLDDNETKTKKILLITYNTLSIIFTLVLIIIYIIRFLKYKG